MSAQWGPKDRRLSGARSQATASAWRLYKTARTILFLSVASAGLAVWAGAYHVAAVLAGIAAGSLVTKSLLGRLTAWSHGHHSTMNISRGTVDGISERERHDLANTIDKYR